MFVWEDKFRRLLLRFERLSQLHYVAMDDTDVQMIAGIYTFDGSSTGLGLADFLAGRLAQLDQAAPNSLYTTKWHATLVG